MRPGPTPPERSINLLLEEGMHVRIVELEGGLDPDEYCKERGADAYRAKLDKAPRTITTGWQTGCCAKFELARRQAGGAPKILMPAIHRLPDEDFARGARGNDAAGYLGLDAAVVRKDSQSRHGSPRKG